jgi:hypothetical protein
VHRVCSRVFPTDRRWAGNCRRVAGAHVARSCGSCWGCCGFGCRCRRMATEQMVAATSRCEEGRGVAVASYSSDGGIPDRATGRCQVSKRPRTYDGDRWVLCLFSSCCNSAPHSSWPMLTCEKTGNDLSAGAVFLRRKRAARGLCRCNTTCATYNTLAVLGGCAFVCSGVCDVPGSFRRSSMR